MPAGFDYPRPQRLTPLSGIHQVASDRIYVVDAQTFLLPNFTYDGQAPGMVNTEVKKNILTTLKHIHNSWALLYCVYFFSTYIQIFMSQKFWF